MKALILAAGMGMRLDGGAGQPPKCLLEFGEKTLLRRHLEILERVGVGEVVIGIGYESEMICEELRHYDGAMRVRTVFNPDFHQGNIVTLWHLREELRKGEPLLLMDADVLYDHRIMNQLVHSPHQDCFLMDREFEPGDEPVKLCLLKQRIIEFSKQPEAGICWDTQGESVGFFKLSAETALALESTAEKFISNGQVDSFYEDALRLLALGGHGDGFGVEDITGLPWIEIDFKRDIETAKREVLPALRESKAA